MSATILVIDDEEHFRTNSINILTLMGYEVIGVGTMAEAREQLRQEKADLILLDVNLPDAYGPNLLDETARMVAPPPIIVITGAGDIDMAVDAMKRGAHDFVTKPINFEQLNKSFKRALEVVSMRRELAHLRQTRQGESDMIVGKTAAMRRVLEQARRAGEAQVSVLITGETGTGKEVLANYIHKVGTRVNKPFIAINCAAFQTSVLESELLGHEAEAFTGAIKRKPGLLEVANDGILFMDEISSMSPEMQSMLLRALEERSFYRMGGTTLVKVDVQILAASNRNLQKMMDEGKFREDLYYRLKVVDLHLPPLRERKEDIPEFVGLFVRHFNAQMGKNVQDVMPRALEALAGYDWPGNIRQLRNAIERAMLFCDDEKLDLCHLPLEVTGVDYLTQMI